MNTTHLKKFAQAARRQLREQVAARLERVLKTDSAELREKESAVKELHKQIALTSREAMIDRVAYIWFNRFCALRFMDVNRYTRIGTVSPAEGFTQPEILADAKQGHIDDSLDRFLDRQHVFDLLAGRLPSRDPQAEAYRLLLVAVCNSYHAAMPFLFEKIVDYTELLMPDDLLSESSILTAVRNALTPDACEDVEVIGWLYQFYISEKKDEVFAELKKNRKITPENIPAATQLFTPHWIVRYLVENSLGRLWMLNRPNSRLVDRMDYYIQPEQPETDFLRISTPEEIKICDPACGSGHMLTYAFELLYTIYEEEGYEPTEIPSLILENNLYGIEIDERAGELAAFALTMKAREKYRRFFRRPIQPNIYVLENITFEAGELKAYMDEVGNDLFTANLETTLSQFEEADNFGSLIRPALTNVADVLSILEEKNVAENLFLRNTHECVLQVLRQTDYLSQKYHLVIANPPYMGGKGMNGRLKKFAQDNYPESKSDLFAMFIERNLDLAQKKGMVAMITMQSWMFLSSFEKLREEILSKHTILSMAHLGARAFDSIGGEVVSTTGFVVENARLPEYKGAYLRLIDGNSEVEKQEALYKHRNTPFRASAADFKKIPGSPIAYWVSDRVREIFEHEHLFDYADSGGRCKTHNDEQYVRMIWEISQRDIGIENKWKLYNKGGVSRKWYGNLDFVINWTKEAKDYYAQFGGLSSASTWNRIGITWSGVTSGETAYRLKVKNSEYASASPTVLTRERLTTESILGFLNTRFSFQCMKIINPTMQVNVGDALKLPFRHFGGIEKVDKIVARLITGFSFDWEAYETSWDFTDLPLLRDDFRRDTLADTYAALRDHWREMTQEMQRLEEENNRIFIDAYGLQDELTPNVPLEEITLTWNPHYRYRGNKTEEELEALLLADTMREFISYAVGCTFGRYSLEKQGLILASQGETTDDYRAIIPEPTFAPDADNVIPMLDGDWFPDDIAERFRHFLRVTFGEKHYEENLDFIENAIGKDIRRYFLRDFYNDHVKRYKKRPIYWMFSSPKGSFNALIYMHRYRPDTVSIVLNDYLREFRTKLTARREHLDQIRISASASQREKSQALKDIEKLNKTIDELEGYEREVLYPLATQQVEIDLDDGVKVNYNKFGKALKKITGLSK